MTTSKAEDWDLLTEYATQNSEASFRALVERHAGMVYHAALRQIGDPHLAEEVTQAVFIALAQKASRLSSGVMICGWLYRATRYAVLNLARAERSRRRHEQEVVAMQTLVQPEPAHPIWEHISPFLDEALNELSAADRDAILVRYFGGSSHRETSQKLGITEVAAKKRLSRALDRLRSILAKRGIVTPALALTAAFAACGTKAAPAGLSSSVASAALSHVAGASVSSPLLAAGILSQMALSKAKLMALAAIAALLAVFGAHQALQFHHPAPAVAAHADPPAAAPNPPPQGIVVWDKTIAAPAVNVGNAPLQQALDTISAQAGAYWSVDYVLYDSDDSLRRLLDALRNGGTLSACGWTNLGGAQWKMGEFNVVTARSDNPSGPDLSNNAQAPDTVAMTAVIQSDPSDSAAISEEKKQAMQEAIERSMKQGVSEGTLAPARLLAEASIVPRLKDPSSLTPTREAAARAAHDAQSFWTIIYTLRPSPLAGVGLRISHPPAAINDDNPPFPPFNYPHPTMSPDVDALFDLSPADLAAHQQAVSAWLNQQGKSQ